MRLELPLLPDEGFQIRTPKNVLPGAGIVEPIFVGFFRTFFGDISSGSLFGLPVEPAGLKSCSRRADLEGCRTVRTPFSVIPRSKSVPNRPIFVNIYQNKNNSS